MNDAGPSNPSAESRRIAMIAIRTAPGAPTARNGQEAQAVVVGEVRVPKPGSLVEFEWEWRYALFKLRDLQRLFANAAQGSSFVHPLADPEQFPDNIRPEYYDQLGPNASLLLSDDERNDLLSDDDLVKDLKAELLQPINPPIDAPGTFSPAKVSRLNFAIPLRDVVRVIFYDKLRQPLLGDLSADGGPLMVLDTCRIVNPASVDLRDCASIGRPGPRRGQDWRGSRVILVSDPLRISENNPKPETAKGKLFGFAVLAEMRLPLNGHSEHVSINKYPGLQHGHFRFFAIRAQAEGVPDPRPDFQLFSSDHSTLLGPLLNSMRIGYSVANNLPRTYGETIRNKCVGELSKPETHIHEDPKNPTIVYAVPIIDQLNFGITPEAVRSMGFRLLDKNVATAPYVRMTLRFEAVYQTTNSDLAGNPRLGTDFTLPSVSRAVNSGNGWLRFAQEQREADIDWRLNSFAEIELAFHRPSI